MRDPFAGAQIEVVQAAQVGLKCAGRRIILRCLRHMRRNQGGHRDADNQGLTGNVHPCSLLSPARYLTRVSTAIQFTSQVLPPSSENACSKRHDSAEMSDQTFRTITVRPLID